MFLYGLGRQLANDLWTGGCGAIWNVLGWERGIGTDQRPIAGYYHQ